jgi:hypothetical protein
MEREWLNILFRGSLPITIWPVRVVENIRFPSNWQTALSGNKLLILFWRHRSQVGRQSFDVSFISTNNSGG